MIYSVDQTCSVLELEKVRLIYFIVMTKLLKSPPQLRYKTFLQHLKITNLHGVCSIVANQNTNQSLARQGRVKT